MNPPKPEPTPTTAPKPERVPVVMPKHQWKRKKGRMKRQLMAEQWNEFSQKVLPKDCGPIQRQEMRRAFYAGAEAILFRIIAAFAPEEEPTEADLRVMEDLDAELKDFGRQVGQGRA